jgi:hypothetical protein
VLFSTQGHSLQEGIKNLVENENQNNPEVLRGFSFVTANHSISFNQSTVNVIRTDNANLGAIQKQYNTSPTIINDTQITFLVKQLNKEIDRLKVGYFDDKENKIVKSRIQLINQFVEKIEAQSKQKNITVTFGKLETNLKKLEKQMQSTGLQLFKSTGEKNIADIRRNLNFGKSS